MRKSLNEIKKIRELLPAFAGSFLLHPPDSIPSPFGRLRRSDVQPTHAVRVIGFPQA